MVIRWEVNDLSPKITGSGNWWVTKRPFNAALAMVDYAGVARPYLAEGLPDLNSDGWRVFPDGRMETIYRLRPGLTWHDGRPLTADDFVFAYRVYTAPGLGVFRTTPQDQMEAVLASDPRTLVIRWRSLYPDAGALIDGDLEPLPRHLLEGALAKYEQDPATRDAFLGNSYWTTEYVAAGPFRLERWDPGSHFEGVAFDGHALGRPRIDRIFVRIVADENTTLTLVLAEQAHDTAVASLRFEHALVLRREWAATNKGVLMLRQGFPVGLTVQARPEYAQPAALLDPRVRKALAHAIDRQALNDGLFEGQGFMSESLVPDSLPHAADVHRSIASNLYDHRRSEQLMNESGFSRDREGFFADAAGQRFQLDYTTTAGTESERTQAIVAATWRAAGFEIQQSVMSVARARDNEARHTLPGIGYRGGLPAGERTWTTLEIGTPANRWTSENRPGWSNREYDRAWETVQSTLDRSERIRQVVQMMRLLSEELPFLMLYFSVQVQSRATGLQGPEAGISAQGVLVPESLPYWNIHEWELR
jgi:peptide/nickel transport system substrate-binding protein